MSYIPLERHKYDFLMKHKSPMALRLNDPRHQNIQVGDLVHYSGHNTIMDREKFKVIERMDHPTINQAVDQIKHSGLSGRDKLQMKKAFLGVHGPQSEHHPVVSLHLQPHPMPTRFSQTPTRLG